MKISIAILVISLSITPTLIRALPIAQWTFEPPDQTSASVDPDASATVFNLSSGSVSHPAGNAPTGTTAISGTGWDVPDGAKWWEFTVTADYGYVLNLASLEFDDRASSSGPKNWSLTINGIPTASNQATHTSFSTDPMDAIDLSAFQNLAVADVKIFGFGATSAAGTWRLDNVSLNGTVAQMSSVPDSLPLHFAAAGLIGVLVFARRLRPVSH